VILVEKKSSDGSDQRFAIKVLKKSHIVSCCSVLHRHWKGSFGPCFWASIYYDTVLVLPNKENFKFFEPASYSQRVINTEIYHQFENVMFRCICKIAEVDYELHHVCLAVHLPVCRCGTTLLPLDTFSLNSSLSNLMRIFRKSVKIIGVSLKCDKKSW